MVRKNHVLKNRFICTKISIKLFLIVLVAIQTFVFYQIVIKVCVFKKAVAICLFNYESFTFLIVVSVFTFNLMNAFTKLLTRFDNELAINLALSTNFSL